MALDLLDDREGLLGPELIRQRDRTPSPHRRDVGEVAGPIGQKGLLHVAELGPGGVGRRHATRMVAGGQLHLKEGEAVSGFSCAEVCQTLVSGACQRSGVLAATGTIHQPERPLEDRTCKGMILRHPLSRSGGPGGRPAYVLPVTLASVERGDIQPTIHLTGTVRSARWADLAFEIGGDFLTRGVNAAGGGSVQFGVSYAF